MCLEIYELALARSFTALELALQTALKKTKVKLQLLIDIDKLLIVKKKLLEVEYIILFINMENIPEVTCRWFWVGWRNNFKFPKDFIKNYNEDSDAEYFFFEVDIQYPEELYELHNDLHFLKERIKLERLKNLYLTCMLEKNVLYIYKI